jgi:hypothetical protein
MHQPNEKKYKEIRIDNDLADENGKQVKLKPGRPTQRFSLPR